MRLLHIEYKSRHPLLTTKYRLDSQYTHSHYLRLWLYHTAHKQSWYQDWHNMIHLDNKSKHLHQYLKSNRLGISCTAKLPLMQKNSTLHHMKYMQTIQMIPQNIQDYNVCIQMHL